MRKIIFGMVVGLVIGVVLGSTIVAPRLKIPADRAKIDTKPHGPKERKEQDVSRNLPPLTARKPTVRWRVASAYDDKIPQLETFAARLENTVSQLSGDTLRLKLEKPGTLVPNNEAFDAVRSKAIKAALGVPTFWTDKNPTFQLYTSIPFGPHLQEYLSWLYKGGGHEFLEELYKSYGIHGIVCGAIIPEGSGWFRKPIDDLETFKGIRLSITGLGGIIAHRLGVQLIELDKNQIFKAFENNLIDGAEASQPTADMRLGFHKIAKYYYFPSWLQPAKLLHLIINAETWQNLPEINQIQLNMACENNITQGLALSSSLKFANLKELTKQGVNLQTWSPEIISALKNAWVGIRNEQKKASPEFKRAWESLQNFRNKYAIWREIRAGRQ